MLSLKAKHLCSKLINDMFDAELLIMFLMSPSCSSCSLRKHFGISQSRALFQCPFIRICLSLYYPRRSSVPRISMTSLLSEGFRTTEEGCRCFPGRSSQAVWGHRQCISRDRPGSASPFLWLSWESRRPRLLSLNSWKGRTGSSPTQGRAGMWAVRCIRLRGLQFTTDSTSGLIWSGCSRSFPIRRRKASRIRTVFRGRTRSLTGSGKEREAVRNKGEILKNSHHL